VRYRGGGAVAATLTVSNPERLNVLDSAILDPTDNPPLCTQRNMNPGTTFWLNQWRSICTVSGPVTQGLYVVHVWSSGTGSGTGTTREGGTGFEAAGARRP